MFANRCQSDVRNFVEHIADVNEGDSSGSPQPFLGVIAHKPGDLTDGNVFSKKQC